MTTPLLEVEGLNVQFEGPGGITRAAEGLSFRVDAGEIVGLVGESGCGKSASSLALMGLLPTPAGRIAGGSIRLRGEELANAPARVLRDVRGRRIAMIFQDPMKCLNPYLRLDEQLEEGPRLHLGLSRADARARALDWLQRVGIPDPSERIRVYPHQLSGGMRQRVMIAMALACEPELLIADEPTTALDVSIQAQILRLLAKLAREHQVAVLFITHDLGIVSGLCDRVLVMYAGRIVEEAPTAALFQQPAHPYTRALLRCGPRLDGPPVEVLASIDGLPPRLDRGPFTRCTFAPRCEHARAACLDAEPPLRIEPDGRKLRCVGIAGETR